MDIQTNAGNIARRVQAAQNRREAFAMRIAGRPYPEIAEQLGVSLKWAYTYVRQAIEEVSREPDQQLIELEVARLDAMLMAIWPKIERGSLLAVEEGLRIMERRARLLGLDKPQRIDVGTYMADQAVVIANATGLEAKEILTMADRILKQNMRTMQLDARRPL